MLPLSLGFPTLELVSAVRRDEPPSTSGSRCGGTCTGGS